MVEEIEFIFTTDKMNANSILSMHFAQLSKILKCVQYAHVGVIPIHIFF